MIVIYPMLVSRAVGPNVIPGICKMIENYIMLYSMDDVLSEVRIQAKMNYKIKGKKIMESDHSSLLGEADPWFDPGTKKDYSLDDPAGMDRDELEREKVKIQQAKHQMDQQQQDLENEYKKAEEERKRAEEQRKQAEEQRKQAKDSREIEDAKRKEEDAKRKEVESKLKIKSAKDKKQELKLKQDDAERRDKELDHRITMDLERSKRDTARDLEQREKDRKEEEDKKKAEKEGKKAAKATITDLKSVSLEPSSIKVANKDGSESIIGVKVVPIRVKSDAKLSHLMVNDLKFGFIRSTFIAVGRKVMRWMYQKLGSQDYDVATGDIRKDMFMARTGLKGNAFVVLSKDEDIDTVLFSQPKKIQKLFSLSWGNMIMADDINRVAYFCMKKFKGLCSMIPYGMIYQTLGQTQVFDDLEDVRRKSGAVFKRKPTKMKKVFAEQHSQIKLSDYQYVSEDSKNGKNR